MMIPALGHRLTPVAKVEPSCTTPGTEPYWKCTRDGCDKLFSDADGKNEITAPVAIEALGHTPVAMAGKEPTCTTPGNEACWKCTRCDKLFSDAEGKNEITAPAAIEALGHQLSTVWMVKPTCTTPGNEECWKCTRCDKLFSDAEGKNEITAPAAIEALGHQLSYVEKVKPTCTTPGAEAYWKCTRCDKLFSDADGKNEITAPAAIKALGHNWSEWTVSTEPQVGIPGVKIRSCRRCYDCEQKKIPAPEKPSSPNGVGIDIIARAELPFMDVTRGIDIYDDVKYVYEKGIMEGMSDTEFGPELPMTRGMIATILHRMAGEPKVPYAGVFSDVSAGQWYTDGVEWAASAGLVLGYGDGTFGTTDNVTREQLAVILYRYAQWKGYAVKTAHPFFLDSEDVSATAVEAMDWAVASGILRPDGDHNIRPGADATRGEIATAIHAFLENVAR